MNKKEKKKKLILPVRENSKNKPKVFILGCILVFLSIYMVIMTIILTHYSETISNWINNIEIDESNNNLFYFIMFIIFLIGKILIKFEGAKFFYKINYLKFKRKSEIKKRSKIEKIKRINTLSNSRYLNKEHKKERIRSSKDRFKDVEKYNIERVKNNFKTISSRNEYFYGVLLDLYTLIYTLLLFFGIDLLALTVENNAIIQPIVVFFAALFVVGLMYLVIEAFFTTTIFIVKFLVKKVNQQYDNNTEKVYFVLALYSAIISLIALLK